MVSTVAACLFLLPLGLAGPAVAQAPEFLFQIPPESVAAGSGAGQLSGPRDLGANPSNGRLYVSDSFNARISEFTAWGAFVTAWGWDVAPDGAPGDTLLDGFEICSSQCQAGDEGSAPGQFSRPNGMAVDAAGAVYVFDRDNRRVQKFSAAGEFLLMFGGEVNKTTLADVCTKADLEGGDECGAGTGGEGNSHLSSAQGNYIAYSPSTGTIFVGDDKEGVQEFETDGDFKSKISLGGELAEKSVGALDADTSGNLYLVLNGVEGVHKISASGAPVAPFVFGGVKEPIAVAVDVEGSVYAIEKGGAFGFAGQYAVGFEPDGDPIAGMEAEDEFGREPQYKGQDLLGMVVNFCPGSEIPGNLYLVRFNNSDQRSYVTAYGTGPVGCEQPPLRPPEIKAQYAIAVGTDTATLKAEIHPHFWPGATYFVQYGTTACPAAGWEGPACTELPAPPGLTLTEKSVGRPLPTGAIFLGGLDPETTYHYHFVAESAGGGPVFGEGGGAEEVVGEETTYREVGEEGTFTTFASPPKDPDPCPGNDLPRNGPAERLPDCRAYELVSPLDKNNADIRLPALIYPRGHNQGAASGERLSYAAATAFANPMSSPYVSQYLADRGAGVGWSSEAISPPRTRLIEGLGVGAFADSEFKAFSADLCHGWLLSSYDPPLEPAAPAGFPNIYRRNGCAGMGYEALTRVAPEAIDADDLSARLQFQGGSADGSHAVFVAPATLPGSGAPKSAGQHLRLYEHVTGEPLPRFVCVLPNGTPSKEQCFAGTADTDGYVFPDQGSFHNAISADGERIFWSLAASLDPGKIFVRIGGAETLQVSSQAEALAKSSGARFWGAAADGSRAIFTTGGRLFSFDVDAALAEEAGTTTQIAGEVLGLLGASEDARQIYLASREALTGPDTNNEGDKAQPGEPNLYLWDEGSGVTFVGTLAEPEDTGGIRFPISPVAFRRSSRVSPDGGHAAFISAAPLTGYENLDAVNGEPDAEVFLYDAAEAELSCVSCNPSNARPLGHELPTQDGVPARWVAALLPGWGTPLYASRALAEHGGRLFFESYESLVPLDTNGVKDVYQWEEAGVGSCDGGDPTFNPDSGGCVELISVGDSPRDSSFMDADRNGDDVFFTTLGSLVTHDYGLVDVYDARVGGGLPPPPGPPFECEGEACQAPPAPPEDPSPASSVFRGAGNVLGQPSACPGARVRQGGRCCPKGKRRAKARCIKKKSQRTQGKRRRAGR